MIGDPGGWYVRNEGGNCMYYGSIEAGGTKFVCAVGDHEGQIIEKVTLPTTKPCDTLNKVIDFFRTYTLKSIGLGCFGPIDLDRQSSTYGYVTSTPKQHWKNINIVGILQEGLKVPVVFDTDVNAAAFGEAKWGAAKEVDSCLYMTVGTGIGVGAIAEGKLLHGLIHPEMGHILLRRQKSDAFEGVCPYHRDCLEGLASGPAIEARWGMRGQYLWEREEVWELEAYYIAQALVNYILILSPKKIILGGGVMKQKQLFPSIHQHVRELLNGYIQHEFILENIHHYIVPPYLGDEAGVKGGLALAMVNEE